MQQIGSAKDWYIGYDLNESLPDHSSLKKIRTRYGIEVFRRFFDAIVEQCQQAKLVWGKELYIDSTQVNANADLEQLGSSLCGRGASCNAGPSGRPVF